MSRWAFLIVYGVLTVVIGVPVFVVAGEPEPLIAGLILTVVLGGGWALLGE